MEEITIARLARGLAVAVSLAVGITCASPTSTGIESHSDERAAFRSQVAFIHVTLAEPIVDAGDTTSAVAVPYHRSGKVLYGHTPAWSSSDTTVARVDAHGVVRGVGAGFARIIATTQGVSGSASIQVRAGTTAASVATQLAIIMQPGGGIAGVPFVTQPRVELRDANNLPVPTAAATVTATVTGGGAGLAGTTTVTAVNGVVTFSNLSMTAAGFWSLTFTASGLTPVTSAPFSVRHAAASRLVMVTQPSGTATSGVQLATQPAVALRDAYGNHVPQSGIGVTAAILTGGGTLGGSAVVATDPNGVATYQNLSITGTAGDRTLGFSAPGLTGATSGVISVAASAPPTPPPSGDRGLVFASDWSTGTGTGDAARRDASKGRPWARYAGNAPSGIETAASLGLDAQWPTANAYVVRTSEAAMGSMWSQLDVDLGAPAAGTHRYFRVYVAMLWEDNHGDGNGIDSGEHGMETADAGYQSTGGGGDGMNPMMLSRSNGTWNPGYREISTGYRYAASVALAKFRTYRLEWHIAYGVGTYTIDIRLYDGAGQLVASTPDFLRRNPFPIGEPLSSAILSLASPEDHRWFRVGSNGPTSNYPSANVDALDAFRAHGAVAVCTVTWCGPYVPGEAP